MLKTDAYFDTATSTVTYLAWDDATLDAAIIDPVMDYEPHAAHLSTASVDRILADAKTRGLKIVWALDTHAHADHLSAAHHVRDVTGAKVGIGARADGGPAPHSLPAHAGPSWVWSSGASLGSGWLSNPTLPRNPMATES